MRYTIDTEFLENGRTIDLISIGLIAEDGAEYYAVNADIDSKFPWILDHPWLPTHVVPWLPTVFTEEPMPMGLSPRRRQILDLDHPTVRSRTTIAREVKTFLLDRLPGEPIELWADCGGFDYVALSQLWGPMADKPVGVPHFVHDLQQRWEDCGQPALPEQDPADAHHALNDARHDWAVLHALDLQLAPAAGHGTVTFSRQDSDR